MFIYAVFEASLFIPLIDGKERRENTGALAQVGAYSCVLFDFITQVLTDFDISNLLGITGHIEAPMRLLLNASHF